MLTPSQMPVVMIINSSELRATGFSLREVFPPELEAAARCMSTRGAGIRQLEDMCPKSFMLSVVDDTEFRTDAQQYLPDSKQNRHLIVFRFGFLYQQYFGYLREKWRKCISVTGNLRGQAQVRPIDKLDEACTNADDQMMLVQHRTGDRVMS